MANLRGRLLLVAAVGMGGYIAALAVVDRQQLYATLRELHPAVVASVFGLSLVNYALRFLRWDIYLRAIGASVPTGRQLLYYFAGFAFTVTPAKVGEAVRAVYLRPHGVTYAQTLAMLFVERLLDLTVVSLLALLWLVHDARWALLAVITLGLMLSLAAGLAHPAVRRWLLAASATRGGRIGRGLAFLARTASEASSLLSLRRLLIGVALGLLAWGAEGIGLYLLVHELNIPLGIPGAVGAYALATLAGAASFIPGGLGGAEAVMALLLNLAGATPAAALAATVMCRLATLWFAVVLGAAAMLALEVLGVAASRQQLADKARSSGGG